jgi:hypothetical protein
MAIMTEWRSLATLSIGSYGDKIEAYGYCTETWEIEVL